MCAGGGVGEVLVHRELLGRLQSARQVSKHYQPKASVPGADLTVILRPAPQQGRVTPTKSGGWASHRGLENRALCRELGSWVSRTGRSCTGEANPS